MTNESAAARSRNDLALEQPDDRQAFSWRRLLANNTPVIALVLLCVAMAVTSPHFLRLRNILNILDQVTVMGIMAIGMTLVIIIGGIDLSVGAVLGLSMMIMGWLAKLQGLPWPFAIVVGILVGGLCGYVTGLLITRLNLPAFIATLAMMSITRGLANIITNGRQIISYPEWFVNLSVKRHFGFLSVTVGILIILAVIGWLVVKYRPFGRSLYAIGGNHEVAYLAGISVKGITTWVYVACGLLCGLAGVVMATRLDSSQPSAGTGYEMNCIASVVIGGASLSGGIGSVGGTMMGVFIIGVLRNGLNLHGVSPFVQQVVIGCVIILAVTLDNIRRRENR
ncbi:MAG: ABC transporter permease [Planctomycetaceae bacterium]|nr:ABC transporter permease [Planctomycetaceae bacterium]